MSDDDHMAALEDAVAEIDGAVRDDITPATDHVGYFVVNEPDQEQVRDVLNEHGFEIVGGVELPDIIQVNVDVADDRGDGDGDVDV